jgi:hypothetical protein
MKKMISLIAILCMTTLGTQAGSFRFGKGQLTVTNVAQNAVRKGGCRHQTTIDYHQR